MARVTSSPDEKLATDEPRNSVRPARLREAPHALTDDEVHERLMAMLDRLYGGNVELMATRLRMSRAYAWMLVKKQRPVPRWMLDRLGIVCSRVVTIERYDA